MTKAEEAALKAYPVNMTPLNYLDLIEQFGGKTEIDVNTYPRCQFQEGYEQAEKDAALIPKDIEEIIHIYHIVKMTINEDDDEFYQDILDEYYRRKALEEQ